MGALMDAFWRTLAYDPNDYPLAPKGVEDVGMMRAGNETRKGDWMEVASGTRFYPLDPRAEEVHLVDIASSLSKQCRYNGHTRFFYSVGEHSLLMADWLYATYGDPFLAYQGLMHDAPEAYIGDMVRPLKRNMPDFVAAERPIWQAITHALPILQRLRNWLPAYELDGRVKEADNRILVDERAQVMRPSSNPWGIDHLEPLGVTILGLEPGDVETRFLAAEEEYRLLAV